MAEWKFNGLTAEALGIKSTTIERHNQAADVCRLTLNSDVDAAALWDFQAEVEVKRDGNVIFTGYAQPPAQAGEDSAEWHEVEILGPWWRLERAVMVQGAPSVTAPAITEIAGRRRGFVSTTDGTAMTTRQMLIEVLEYARGRGFIAGWSGIEDVDDTIYAPAEEWVDRSVAEVLRAVLRYHVNVAALFDGGKTLRLRKRGAHAHLLDYTFGEPPLASASTKLRSDLAPRGVFIRYERRRATQSASGYKDFLGYDVAQQVGEISIRPGDDGVITDTVTLEPDEPQPQNLAAQWLRMFSQPVVIEGTLTFKDEECDTGILPGHSISVDRVGRDAAISQAFVQSVTENVESGITTVEVGLPAHLGLNEFIDLVRRKHWRTRDDTDGDPPRSVEAPSTALTPYLARNASNLWVLRVSDGTVSDGLTERTPEWLSLSTQLDALVPPEIVLVRGGEFNVYLLMEYTPTALHFTVLDEDGDNVTEYGFDEEGTLDRASVQITLSAARAASVNADSGAVVSGRFYIKIGSVYWALANAEPSLSVSRTGNFQVMHRAPSRLLIIPTTTSE